MSEARATALGPRREARGGATAGTGYTGDGGEYDGEHLWWVISHALELASYYMGWYLC
jgi:hypothetical protein